MTAPSARPLLSPEEIAVRAGEQVPFIRFPERALVFAEREMRLRQLAPGHAMGDYLRFVAELAHAQDEVLRALPAPPVPSADEVARAARAGQPLLMAGAERDPAWRGALRRVLETLARRLDEGPALEIVRELSRAGDARLEQQADRLLGGVMLGLDLATAPLVGAGLQVWFTHRLLATRDAHAGASDAAFGRVDDPTRCPCCGSLPVSGVLRIGGGEGGFRYLACSLCSAQWHMVRIKCSHCLSTEGIGYRSLRSLAGGGEDDDAAVASTAVEGAESSARAIQAECCSKCGHYLKMLHMQRDPHVDPVADDLASLTLDLLVSEEGLVRHGVDLMLLFGDPDATPGPGSG